MKEETYVQENIFKYVDKENVKTFVLDTNILLQSPHSLFNFTDNIVIIPETVLEELDNFKKDKTELGSNARESIRLLESVGLRGNILEGVYLEEFSCTIKIEINHKDIELPNNWEINKADNRILQICKALKDEGEKVYLITKDIVLRIKANLIGIEAEDIKSEQVVEKEKQYKGRNEVFVDSEDIDNFFTTKQMSIDRILFYEENRGTTFTINEFFIMKSRVNPKHSALGRFDGKKIVPLIFSETHPYGITARNIGQKFMIEALMMNVKEAPLVICKGPAGTAKTLLSLAVGLEKIVETKGKDFEKEFRKILVCRPNVKMDEDIGYLPGTEEEKIAPLMRPIFDNLEVLADGDSKERYRNEDELSGKVDYFFEKKIINMESVAFLRGRSISKQWIIIDECQNLTKSQVKGIITRAGDGTKIILAGDPDQIDHPFLDERNNGLSYASEMMKGSKYCYQVTFDMNEAVRSDLAREAAERL